MPPRNQGRRRRGQQPPPPGSPPPVLDGLPELGDRVNYLRVPSIKDKDDYSYALWPKEYKKQIKRFRKKLGTKYYRDRDDIFLLPGGGEETHHLVLYTETDRLWVVLDFRIRDLYLIGFTNRQGSFEFDDANCGGNRLGFESSYLELGRTSNSNIFRSVMGWRRLEEVVKYLSDETTSLDKKALALMISTVMFSEAARFQFLMKLFQKDRSGYVNISSEHMYYMKNWSNASKVLIAANARPGSIDHIDAILANGDLGFPQIGGGVGQYLQNVEELKSVLRVMCNQTVADSLPLVGLV